jgi:AcrR family transcriptional regulator
MTGVNAGSPRSRRSRAAEQTRLEIVDAARGLFLRDGYVGTTIGAIAEEAGVAVQTLYNSIGSKAAILSRLLDVTITGDHDDRSLLDRIRARPGFDTWDARAIVRDVARTITDVAGRIADLWEVVESAAAVDAEIAAIVAANNAGRFSGYTVAARRLSQLGALRPGLSTEAAASVVWSLAQFSSYRFLIDERGWSAGRYRRWLDETLAAALLSEPLR